MPERRNGVARYVAIRRALQSATSVDFNATSPGSWLLKQVPWSEAEHLIRAVNADKAMASHLDLAEGTACLVVERRTRYGGESITQVVLSYPGSSYQLVARF